MIKMETVPVTAMGKQLVGDWTWEVEKAARDRDERLTQMVIGSFFMDLEGIRAAPGSDVRSGLVTTLAREWKGHDGILGPDDAYAYLWSVQAVAWTERALMATTLVALDLRLPHSFSTRAHVEEYLLREVCEEHGLEGEMAFFPTLSPDNVVVTRLWFSNETAAVAARMAL